MQVGGPFFGGSVEAMLEEAIIEKKVAIHVPLQVPLNTI
jgi:hypothetical protein